MEDSAKLIAALEEVAKDSEEELKNHPTAATGKCVISSSGYSECKNGMTEDACNRQKGYGITVKWTKDASC